MPRITRRRLVLLLAVAGTAAILLCLTVFRRPLAIAYHQWRMNAEYDTVFGHPEPAGDGLASYDLRGIDVDAVMARYERHRQALVDLGFLCHMSARLPRLASDGTKQQLAARSAFVRRMWRRFPGHKHYYLAPDGTFETWVPVGQKEAWDNFIDAETESNQPAEIVPRVE
jgi:hypothetical protein